jgi:hypothetical protein
MASRFPLFVHVGRKVLVKSLTRNAEVELPAFYKADEVLLEVTLVRDHPQATTALPFEVVPPADLDLRVGIGNGLSGAARKVMAQQVTFRREATAFVGVLSLGTEAVVAYLTEPAPWTNTTFARGAKAYSSSRYWKTLQAVTSATGVPPEDDPTNWLETDLEREPLFFEVEIQRDTGPETVLQMACSVRMPVIDPPLVDPELVGDPDGFADALLARLAESSTVRFTKNQDALNDALGAAPTWVGTVRHAYQSFVWDATAELYRQALREIKAPVRVRATGNRTVAGAVVAIEDGVTLALHDRVLLDQQTDAEENGIYTVEVHGANLVPGGAEYPNDDQDPYDLTVTSGRLYYWSGPAIAGCTISNGSTTLTAAGVIRATSSALELWAGPSALGGDVLDQVRECRLVRATDFDGADDLTIACVVPVTAGSANAGQRRVLATTGTIVVGTTALVFGAGPGSGTIQPSEQAYWVTATPAYDAPAWTDGYEATAGEMVQLGGQFYVAHTDHTDETPTNRLYWGKVLPFDPDNRLFANVKIAPGRGLYVMPNGTGVAVDFTKAVPNYYTALTEIEFNALLARALAGELKQGDIIIYNGDQYRITEITNVVTTEIIDPDDEEGTALVAATRARASNVATITLATAHPLVTGNRVRTASFGGTGFNLPEVEVTVTGPRTLTFPCPGTDVPATADTAGRLFPLIPVVTTPAAPSDATPAAIAIGGVGKAGVGLKVAREDHEHPAPGLATAANDGFMSKEQALLLEQLAGGGGGTAGFDAPVRALRRVSDRVYVGGDFTKHGAATAAKIARLTLSGTLDTSFETGAGFTQSIAFLARASDGDVLAGSATAANTYQGVAGGFVWKLNADGTPDGDWVCPAPIASIGTNELVGLAATSAGDVVMVTPQTFRVTDLEGTSLFAKTGTVQFRGVALWEGTKVFLSSNAFASAGVGQAYDGVTSPKGLKLVNVAEDGANPAGAVVPAWISGGGSGAAATCAGLAVGLEDYSLGAYVVAGCSLVSNGVDFSWNGGSALLFGGLYKIKATGEAAPGFDVELTLETGATPIPFFIDSLGRIYFGGGVTAINGTSVTPWRLYRITKAGVFDREFSGFNGRVLTAVNSGDDLIIAGGEFTEYKGRSVGYIVFLNAVGDDTGDGNGNFALGDDEGLVKTFGPGRAFTALPSAASVAANPRLGLHLWKSDQWPVALYLWVQDQNRFVSSCDICVLPSQLPPVEFDPASGTAIGGGINVALTVPGHGSATIRYTDDGSEPDSTSTVYTTPIAVASPTTIKAYASVAGYRDSDVATAQYDTSALDQLPAVTFSPASGGTVPLTVTLECAEAGVTIRYTTNGLTPTSGSATYSGPITLTTGATIKAIAFKSGWVPSVVASATYANPVPLPKPFILSGTFQLSESGSATPAGQVTIRIGGLGTVPGQVVRYTLDGNDPTESSPIAPQQPDWLLVWPTDGELVAADPAPERYRFDIRARAYKTGWLPSPVNRVSVSYDAAGKFYAYE